MRGQTLWLLLMVVPPVLLGTEVATAGHGQGPETPAPVLSEVESHRQVIDAYCVVCHNKDLLTGGLDLDGLDLDEVGRDAEIWEKVFHKLSTGQMPPTDMPQMDEADSIAMVSWLESTLDGASRAQPNPGKVGVHRLNRTEYANAVRDLLAVEVDPKALLLPDETDEGFDNVAASLTISPAHLERYLSAARKISRLAVGDPTMGVVPGFKVYQVPRMLNQDSRVSEDLPFGARGGAVIRHQFSLDGEYLIKVRLRRQIYDYIVGLRDQQLLDLRVDGKRVARFTVGGIGNEKGTPAPLTWVGAITGDIEWEEYMHTADDMLEVRVPVRAGARAVSVSFVNTPRESETIPQATPRGFSVMSDHHYDGYAAVDSVAVGGPYQSTGSGDTPSRSAVFVCRPETAAEESPCARTILSGLARRAYRRPVTEDEVQMLLDFYDTGRDLGGFEMGIQSALERLLVGVNFLVRVENPPPNAGPGTVYRLSDLDLASRLSFFLWSSIPDTELLDVAISGQLADPAVLESQVRRMLSDPRAKTLPVNFASQWLTVRRVGSWQPDADLFPDFDENLRDAFIRETELFIDSQFDEDRSIVDLLRADYSFVNERLAEHYELPGIYGERFRRVKFDDGRRGGLLGQGGVLMVTSYPDRTAPVVRGVWLLRNILGMPPPPPPPSVPDLKPKGEDGRLLSMREQMEQHRQNPACAVCHVRMDPLGFALENFDAVGRWRAEDGGSPIDATSTFMDGTPIDGVGGVRDLLLSHPRNFARTFTEKLLTYALGRRVEYYDHPAIRRILREAESADYSWSSIIVGVVKSLPFQMRRTAS
jgi:mono/diheme cytochrome c family protein